MPRFFHPDSQRHPSDFVTCPSFGDKLGEKQKAHLRSLSLSYIFQYNTSRENTERGRTGGVWDTGAAPDWLSSTSSPVRLTCLYRSLVRSPRHPQTQGPFSPITPSVDSGSSPPSRPAHLSLTITRCGEEAKLFHPGLPEQEFVSSLYKCSCTPLPGDALGLGEPSFPGTQPRQMSKRPLYPP